MESGALTGERYAIPKDFDADRSSATRSGSSSEGPARSVSASAFPRKPPTKFGRWRWHPQQKIETDAAGGEAILELPAESMREARGSSSPTAGTPRCSRRPSSSRTCGREASALAQTYGVESAARPRPRRPRAETGRSRAPPGVLEAAMNRDGCPSPGLSRLGGSRRDRMRFRGPCGPCPIPTRTSLPGRPDLVEPRDPGSAGRNRRRARRCRVRPRRRPRAPSRAAAGRRRAARGQRRGDHHDHRPPAGRRRSTTGISTRRRSGGDRQDRQREHADQLRGTDEQGRAPPTATPTRKPSTRPSGSRCSAPSEAWRRCSNSGQRVPGGDVPGERDPPRTSAMSRP